MGAAGGGTVVRVARRQVGAFLWTHSHFFFMHWMQGPVGLSSVRHFILDLIQAQHFPSGSCLAVASVAAGEMVCFMPADATVKDSYMAPRLCQ